MRVLFLFLLGLLLGCGGPSAPLAPPSHVDSAAALSSKTVALVQTISLPFPSEPRPSQLRSYCSGVWLSGTVIVTANHCVDDVELGDAVEYVVQGDVFTPGTLTERDTILTNPAFVLARDEAHDLALLRAPAAPPHADAFLSIEIMRPGMRVQSMGQPLGLWWSYSSGDVAAVRMIEGAGQRGPMLFVQATSPISPGNSGGGLFDEWGMLVGIAHATFTRGQNVNLFIHYQYVDALYRRAGTQHIAPKGGAS